MIVVHHLNNSRSQRILWLHWQEELGVPYEVKGYQRNSLGVCLGTQNMRILAPKALFEVTPLIRQVPCNYRRDVMESSAIVEYLITKYSVDGNLQAPSSRQGYAEASLMPLLVQRLIFTNSPRSMPEDIRSAATSIFDHVQQQRIDPEIQRNAVFVFIMSCRPTSADFAMSFPLEGLAAWKMAGPKCMAYFAKMQARYALEKSGSRYNYTYKL
ncbi:hypothetical protein B0H10DRAFT_2288082 [Mycena sp. CBHHK59/15]|nr:hypothetical protein B0H10DRAFT_2288082 [Mycena sp. CBHHK59/15]